MRSHSLNSAQAAVQTDLQPVRDIWTCSLCVLCTLTA